MWLTLANIFINDERLRNTVIKKGKLKNYKINQYKILK